MSLEDNNKLLTNQPHGDSNMSRISTTLNKHFKSSIAPAIRIQDACT